jgi:hypothetical protein
MKCHNNWINLSWDGLPARVNRENLQVKFNSTAKSVVQFDRACDLVAEEIADTHRNLYLAMSGGSDSEYVAKCLLRNRIPFTPIILDYNTPKHNDQRYERWYAIHWCKANNIEPWCVDVNDYCQTSKESMIYSKLRPRLFYGVSTMGLLLESVTQKDGYLVTGSQLEYYPDHEQMTYLEPQLGTYQGFVMQETDLYLETLQPDHHPWAFFYWSPEVMASFVSAWDNSLTIQENKSQLYKTSPRPKYVYPWDLFTDTQVELRKLLTKQKWGTRDCALLGNKEQLLNKLLG